MEPERPSKLPQRSPVPAALASALLFCVAAGGIIWFSVWQARGLLRDWTSIWVSALPRLTPLMMLALLSVAFVGLGQQPLGRLVRRGMAAAESQWRLATGLIVAVGFLLTLVAVWVLRAFPNSGDEYEYIFQAKTFLSGHLWLPLLPGHEFFSFGHIFEKDGKWIAQYAPGWPLLLAAAHLLGLPFWLVSPLLGALLLVVLARLTYEHDGPIASVAALALIAVSPFFAFNAGSYFSHVPATLFGAIFCWQGMRFLHQPRHASAALAGAALGMMGLIRTFDVPFFVVPFGLELLRRGRWGHCIRAPTILLSGVPFLIALLLYQREITGSPFTEVTQWGYPLLHIGFHPVDEFGYNSTFSDIIHTTLVRFLELVEWTSPAIIAYLPILSWKIFRWRINFLDLIFPLAVLFFLLYPSLGVNRYGPRYYFDAFPFLVYTLASGCWDLARSIRKQWLLTWVGGILLTHVLICLLSFTVLTIAFRQIVNERMALYDAVRASGLHNAVVLVRSPTGAIRPLFQKDLTRNWLGRDGDVVYAHDPEGRFGELRSMFPTRRFFVYERGPNEQWGTLSPLP